VATGAKGGPWIPRWEHYSSIAVLVQHCCANPCVLGQVAQELPQTSILVVCLHPWAITAPPLDGWIAHYGLYGWLTSLRATTGCAASRLRYFSRPVRRSSTNVSARPRACDVQEPCSIVQVSGRNKIGVCTVLSK
jgi:hypothetical protein